MDSDSLSAANELYVRYGDVPDLVHYDFAYSVPFSPDQDVVIPTTESGTYYIMVRNSYAPAGAAGFSLLAEIIPLTLEDITPDEGGDEGLVTTAITGAGFHHNATVQLVRPGFAAIVPESYRVVDGTKILARFDFAGQPHGLYDVIVTNPDGQSQTLPYRYFVTSADDIDLRVGLEGPTSMKPGRDSFYTVGLLSQTNVDIPYVRLQYGIPDEVLVTVRSFFEEFDVPLDLELRTNLRGDPQLAGVEWASLDPRIVFPGETYRDNPLSSGEESVTGFAVGFPALSSVFRTLSVSMEPLFCAATPYEIDEEKVNKLQEMADQLGLDIDFVGLFGQLKSGFEELECSVVGGSFPVVATATPLTIDEYVNLQRETSEALRLKVLTDTQAPQGFRAVADDARLWETLYFSSLVATGMMNPEDQPPALVEAPVLATAQAILAAGLLGGELGNEIIVAGTAVDLFAKIYEWYKPDRARAARRRWSGRVRVFGR